MELNPQIKAFIREHAEDDLNRFLLSASRYPEIDMPFVVDQIAARRQIREKLPTWYLNEDLFFPARIAVEQSSSEKTGIYKQQLVSESDIICDLTGGLGIDSFYFSRRAKHVFYIERFPVYCEAARHNFQILNAQNITVIEGNATDLYSSLSDVDVFYIDPARRGESNKRVFALSDCEPDLTVLLPNLLLYAPKVIAKISPMADIQQTLKMLPGTTEVHVLSVKNECKELLFVIERDKEVLIPPIYCINLTTKDEEESFLFTLEEEREANFNLTEAVQSYLYEPNTSILKAGAFKSISKQYGLKKLGVSSHLYTSDILLKDFPGRVFQVAKTYPYTSKLTRTISKQIPQANITVRNFPLSVDELRKRTHIIDGGNIYVFATTLPDNQKILIESCKIEY